MRAGVMRGSWWGCSASPTLNEGSDGENIAPAVIVFTAGTTGDSKAATLAHRSVIANLHSLLLVSGRLPQQLDPEKPGAGILQRRPIFHIGGLPALFLAIPCGPSMLSLLCPLHPPHPLALTHPSPPPLS